MRKRIIGGLVAASAVLMLAPAGSQADTVDTTCRNGQDPVVFVVVDGSPLAKATVRLLCVQD